MKDHVRCGLVTTLVCNIVFGIVYIIVSAKTGLSFETALDKIGYIILLCPLVPSIMCYLLAQQIRQEYLLEKKHYRILVPDISNEKYNKTFSKYFAGKYSRMLGHTSLFGLLLYLAFSLQGEVNYHVLAAFLIGITLFYGFYFKNKEHELADKIKW